MTNADRISASIEMAPKQVIDMVGLADLFPAGTSVYITDLGPETEADALAAAIALREAGYEPVPHIAARRLPSLATLEKRLANFSAKAGVKDVLVIGGGLTEPAGPFSSTMEVLETGLFQTYGIKRIGIAGHPEGSPDFNKKVAIEALRLKQEFGQRTGIAMRIVTQFGFDGESFANWANSLKADGITMPVHLGVAGPAKVTTLIKYAALCGVGNSLKFFKKNTRSIAMLATKHSPEGVVDPIENAWRATGGAAIEQIHIFPFGGVKNAAEWLEQRGTWDINKSLYLSMNSAL